MLNKLTVKTLNKIAKEYDIKYSGINKNVLVQRIQSKLFMGNINDYVCNNNTETDLFDAPRQFVSFTPFNNNYIVDYFLPDGKTTIKGLIAYPININHECLNGVHYNLVKNNYCNNTVLPFNIKEKSKVFVLNSEQDANVLNIICDGNLSNIDKYFDAILISSAYSCYYDQLIVFDVNVMKDKIDNFDITDINNSIIDYLEDRKPYYARDKSRAKRKMYTIYKINASDLRYNSSKKYYELLDTIDLSKCEIRTGESRMLREYEHIDERPIGYTEEKKIVYCADRFIIVSTNDLHQTMKNDLMNSGYKEEDAERAIEIEIMKIFQVGIHMNVFGNESIFRVAVQSASQSRKGKYFFSDLGATFEEMNKCFKNKMLWGALDKLAGAKNIAKFNKYLALCTSTAVEVGNGYTFETIPDITIKLKGLEHYEILDMNSIKGVGISPEDVPFTPGDGGGTIRPRAMARVACQLGLISDEEYDYFRSYFINIADVRITGNKKLRRIFDTLPTCIQIRHAGDKGLLIMFEHDLYNIDDTENPLNKDGKNRDVDIVVTNSIRKYDAISTTDDKIQLEICAWTHYKNDWSYTNYQFLQSLKLGIDDLIKLAKDFLKQLDGDVNSITSNIHYALKFLGLINNVGSDETIMSDTLVSKLTKILTLSPEMINDEYVQTKLRDLLKGKLEDIAYGRIPVEGSFQFIFSDPRFLLGASIEECIPSGYVFNDGYHGEDDEILMQRSPLIDRSENVIRKTIDVDMFWYMKHTVIFSPNDSALHDLAGADTDGDKVRLTRNKIMIAGAKRDIKLPFVYDGGKDTLPKNYTEAELHNYFLRTSKVDKVGQITNLATCHRDYALHYMVTKALSDDNGYQAKMIRLRFLQGWEIDAPKYDERVTIPDDLLNFKLFPHWFAYWKTKVETEENEITIYRSSSPMGKLFDYMMGIHSGLPGFTKDMKEEDGYIDKFFAKESKGNFTDMLGKITRLVDTNEVHKYIPIVSALEGMYRKEFRDLNDKLEGLTGDEYKKERRLLTGALIDEYTECLNNEVPNKEIGAALAYNVCYKRGENSKGSVSKSFVWSCAWEGMESLLTRMDEAVKLSRLPSINDEVTSVRVMNGMLFLNGMYNPAFLRNTEDGMYEPIEMQGEYYIKTKLHGYNIIQKQIRNKEIEYKIAHDEQITEEEAMFINMDADTIQKHKDEGHILIKEDTVVYHRLISGFTSHGTNSIDFIKTLESDLKNKDIVDVIFNKENKIRLVRNNVVLAGVPKDEVLLWGQFVGKKICIKSTQNPIVKVTKPNSKTVWIDKDNKLAYRNSMIVKFFEIGEASPIDGDLINDNVECTNYCDNQDYIDSFMYSMDEEYVDMTGYVEQFEDMNYIESVVNDNIEAIEPHEISYDEVPIYGDEESFIPEGFESYGEYEEEDISLGDNPAPNFTLNLG